MRRQEIHLKFKDNLDCTVRPFMKAKVLGAGAQRTKKAVPIDGSMAAVWDGTLKSAPLQ